MRNRVNFLTHSGMDVIFTKNSSDFVVKEIPLYEFSGEGEHLILHVRKKDLTTWEMLKIFSEQIGAKVKDFGYAGLKDKDGMTIQYISVHKSYEKRLQNFSHPNIKILETSYHKNKIKIGHLKGNRFFIRLKRVGKVEASKLKNALEILDKEGYPNYFGYQRFGKDEKNYLIGKEILEGKRRERNRKKRNFFVNSYQSYIFNDWLSYRVELSHNIKNFDKKELIEMSGFDSEFISALKKQKQFFKIIEGDVLHHYPFGKAFICENTDEEVIRFQNREVTVTGWLFGAKNIKAEKRAKEIEDKFFGEIARFVDKMDGGRRFAWSFLEDLEMSYKEDEKWFEMHFTLQKGSYATEILEELKVI